MQIKVTINGMRTYRISPHTRLYIASETGMWGQPYWVIKRRGNKHAIIASLSMKTIEDIFEDMQKSLYDGENLSVESAIYEHRYLKEMREAINLTDFLRQKILYERRRDRHDENLRRWT